MSENKRHGAADQATNPAGRRRRRRSRRRGSSNATAGSTPTETNSPATNTTTQPKRRRRRRRRTTEGTNTEQHAPRTQEKKAKTTRRPARGSNKRRGTNQRSATRGGVATRPRMHTSIETSAGGLVVSGLAESVRTDGSVDLTRLYVALIGRLDRRGRLLWSMPKGHVEDGEAYDSTAEREVWEETGVNGEVFAELGVIDYWFVSDGKRIHKTVHHHLLRFVDGDLNDEDPEVTEVAWVPVSELVERLAYADERKLARRAHDLLPDLARQAQAEGRVTPR